MHEPGQIQRIDPDDAETKTFTELDHGSQDKILAEAGGLPDNPHRSFFLLSSSF